MNRFLNRVMGRFRQRKLAEPTCQEVNGFLAEYLEGTLNAETAAKYEAHLGACPPCGDYFDQYRQTVKLARNCQEEAIPKDLVELTLAFLRERRES